MDPILRSEIINNGKYTILDIAMKYTPPSWEECFQDAKSELLHISNMVQKHILMGLIISPHFADIFNAFFYTRLDKVKVIIFNKSAQPGKIKIGNKLVYKDSGLAYSSLNGDKIPMATQNIFKELRRSIPNFQIPDTGDLRGWAVQGVLLVNLSMTVTDKEEFPHDEIWDGFMYHVIKSINTKNPNAIYVIWGNNIDRVKSLIGDKNLKLECGHPSFNNKTDEGFIECDHFNKINENLAKNGIKKIDWTKVGYESVFGNADGKDCIPELPHDFFEFLDPESKIRFEEDEKIKKEQKKHLSEFMKDRLKRAFESGQIQEIVSSKINMDCIKNWAKEYNIRVKSGLNKKGAVEFIYQEYKKGIIMKSNLDFNYLINDCKYDYGKIGQDIDSKGFTVQKLEGFDTEITKEFFLWIKECYPSFVFEDRNTWQVQKGALNHYISQSEFMWKVRELVLPIYQDLFGEEEVLSSMEGCYFNFENENEKICKIRGEQALSIDQNCNYLSCIRSFVNFVDNNHFVFIENSKSSIDKYLELLTVDPKYKPKIGDPIFEGMNLLRVSCKAGEILMWDARMFYFLTKDEDLNLGAYVSMFTHCDVLKSEIKKRRICYEKGLSTNHWCYGEKFKTFPENRYKGVKIEGKPLDIKIAPLNKIRTMMVG